MHSSSFGSVPRTLRQLRKCADLLALIFLILVFSNSWCAAQAATDSSAMLRVAYEFFPDEVVEIRDFKNMSGLYLTELQAAGLYFERLPLEDDSIEAVRLAKEKGRILNDAEKQIVLDHFTQSREQVIEWVQKSGVPLNFPDGGHMETVGVTPSSTDGVKYPILVQQTEETLKSTDTSGMQRLHAGVDDAGIGVHVVTHFFSGKITWYHKTTKGVARVEVWADDTSGWVVVYRGGNPHGACLHETKFLCQKTGPAEWKTVYPNMLNPFVDKPKWEFSLYNVYAFMFSPRTIVALLACMLIYGMIFQKLPFQNADGWKALGFMDGSRILPELFGHPDDAARHAGREF